MPQVLNHCKEKQALMNFLVKNAETNSPLAVNVTGPEAWGKSIFLKDCVKSIKALNMAAQYADFEKCTGSHNFTELLITLWPRERALSLQENLRQYCHNSNSANINNNKGSILNLTQSFEMNGTVPFATLVDEARFLANPTYLFLDHLDKVADPFLAASKQLVEALARDATNLKIIYATREPEDLTNLSTELNIPQIALSKVHSAEAWSVYLQAKYPGIQCNSDQIRCALSFAKTLALPVKEIERNFINYFFPEQF
jgi:hypothetical protein